MKKTKAAGKRSVGTKTQITDKKLEETLAVLSLLPSTCAADAISLFSMSHKNADGDVVNADFSTLVNKLRVQNECVSGGDLKRIEAMLLDQAHVLQAVFTNFTKRMADAEYVVQLDAYARIALKSQNQCRQTLATLGELKNPKRATFIKQQNNQQVIQAENRKIPEKPSNELLEELPHERLDTRTPQASIRADQAMETMEDGHRAKNTRRKT